ncbi:MAG: sugar transferase [Nitrospirota bacterium]
MKLVTNVKSVARRVRRVVVLAGGQTSRLTPLTAYCPTSHLPILNKPLLEHNIDALMKCGIDEVIVSTNVSEDYLAEDLRQGIIVRYHRERRPRGPAGCLKDIEPWLKEEPFLVLNGSLFIKRIELENFVRFHEESGSMLTVGMHRAADAAGETEHVLIGSDGSLKGFSSGHSFENGLSWRAAGIYLFDPSVLNYIDRERYMDIKEQLVPLLQRESFSVFVSEIKGEFVHMTSVQDYMKANRDLLADAGGRCSGNKEEITKGVWVGRDVTLSPRAYILGPVVIGDNCKIEDFAQIVGPAVIANDCTISEGALLRESILWDGVSLSREAAVEYSILGQGANIPQNSRMKSMIAMNGLRVGDMNLVPEFTITSALDLSWNDRAMGIAYRTIKRAMDLSLSALGILFFLPVFLFIAAAIKIDSRGPIFYVQKRCGLKGRLFGMIKFRTMVADAERMHKQLVPSNETDGPMFKLTNDPRVTRLGRFLRRTSLDEIPQLLNVLKGEMSLVGPRPLITDEMKFSPSWRDIRLKVKPGITGLWQVQGRSNAWFHDWIRFDTFYVKNQSLRMDLEILAKTVGVVLKKVGAY